MRNYILFLCLIVLFSCKEKKTNKIDPRDTTTFTPYKGMISDTLSRMSYVDEVHMVWSIQYKGKTVMRWYVDSAHYEMIEKVYDSLGAIYGLIEELKNKTDREFVLDSMLTDAEWQLNALHHKKKVHADLLK